MAYYIAIITGIKIRILVSDVESYGNKKGDLCYKVAESLAKISPMITWEIEMSCNELHDLAKEISKQSVKGHLAASSCL